jgi:hypothetical protein
MERTAVFSANHYLALAIKETGSLLAAIPRLEGACLVAFLLFALT